LQQHDLEKETCLQWVAKKQRQSILLQQMNDGEGRSIEEDDIPALLYL
jgi:hypothetical protein